ncbi:exonuclease V [Geopyxis carbonaria]|nr:exonuclease V [Geopyxis carbonaria]
MVEVEPTTDANIEHGTSDISDEQKSPYDRWRAKRKGLSVTDLVSNIWCEQQNEYTLKQGFRRRTSEMKRGSEVHKVLEEQVHTIEEVEITTKEESWGLKIFNIYQGLVCLEETGMTRELPVFGFIEGMFVSGIIDEISYADPHTFNPYATGIHESETHAISATDAKIAYLSDVKTRARRSLPTASQKRATELQLMLYRQLLFLLWKGEVDLEKLLELKHLDGNNPFSDGFIARLGSLTTSVSLETLLESNSISGLWSLMHRQLHNSIDSLGDSMGVLYRYQRDGSLIGRQNINNDMDQLQAHLDNTLSWWKGKRETVGVDIEEAWKCECFRPRTVRTN